MQSKLLEFLQLFLLEMVLGLLRKEKNIPLLSEESLLREKQMSYSCVHLVVQALGLFFYFSL